jgi:CheY-like chemotaxis protein
MPSILIADDDRSVRRLLAATLSLEYETLEATDGLEAIAAVEAERPTGVLLDVSMPKMDGLEVCRRIKSNPELADTRVIILTGNPSLSKMSFAAGADHWLAKPFSPIQLLDVLYQATSQEK